MPTTVRWAVLGPGRIARRFASQLPHSRHGRLTAVGSTDAGRAQTFAEEFGASSAGTYEQVLTDPEVDAVYVSTVHTTHAELTLMALAAGKHVLCEKPLAPNHGTAMAVVDAARSSGKVLLEAYMYRFHPLITHVLDLVRHGTLGEVHHVDAAFSFRAGGTGRLFDPAVAGGGILDVGGYPFSFAQAVARASGVGGAPERLDAGGQVSGGVDEWALATLGFTGGLTATIRTGIRMHTPSTIAVHGTAGTVTITDPWLLQPGDAAATIALLGSEPEVVTAGEAHTYALEADALARAAAAGAGEVPELPLDHSLELSQGLDRWRAALGLRYPFETDTADIPPLREVSAPTTGGIPSAPIEGAGEFSRLVLGCDNQPDLAHASALFDAFFASGGTTFDTAYIYGGGLQERLVGQWLRNRGLRDQVRLIVKGAHTPHCDPESIGRQLTESLERLGTDHADLYLMHRDNPQVPVGEFVQALDEQISAGRIRSFGGSNWSLARLQEANTWAQEHQMQGFAALSNHFSLARALDVPWTGCEHVSDPQSRRWLEEQRFPLLPWSAQARGFFTGRAHPQDRSDAELVRCYYSEDNFERLHRASQMAAERDVPTTAIALAYVLAQSFPTFALIGPRSLAELRSSMLALQVELSAEDVAWLDLRDQEEEGSGPTPGPGAGAGESRGSAPRAGA
ncbi:aldo/keto reductase [Pseudactinotalea sp. Z1739]|uniref:aldo/keto reductase n=1 Tax=Pseudactinotalea sp. Z1739 TaxID=3413028 RepID=UPI003C7CE2A9